MAKVRRIAWRPFRIPFREEFSAAHGAMEAREGFVVRLTDNAGRVGLGEASPLPLFAGGSLEETADALERLARAAVRWQTADIVRLVDKRRGWLPERAGILAVRAGAAKPAVSALQSAAADTLAHASGVPAYEILKPLPEEPAVTGTPVTIPVNAVIGLAEPEAMAREARQAEGQGFGTIKLKLSDDADLDLARVAAVREAVAPETKLRLDANASWPFEEAGERLAALRDFDIEFVEQPISPGEGVLEQLRQLQQESGVPLAVDEGVVFGPAHEFPAGVFTDTPPYFDAYVSTAVCKPMFVDVDMLRSFLILANRGRLRTVITTSFDTGIGTAYSMQLAALLPDPRMACGLDTLRFLEGDIVTGVPEVANGQVTLSERPGLGIELDEHALERYATGPWREVHA